MTKDPSDDPLHSAGPPPKPFDPKPGEEELRKWIREVADELRVTEEDRKLERFPELDRNGNPQDKAVVLNKLDQTIARLRDKKLALERELREHLSFHKRKNRA